MKSNAYVPESRNEGGRVAAPTSFSIFDSYDMKSSRFKVGHGILTGFKNGKALKMGCLVFQLFYELKLKASKLKILAF